jgi:starch-binding outer membrane protein, SusD/RagB family
MKTIKILFTAIIVFFLTSCGEDFLDLTPPFAISDQEAYENLDDFYTGLNGVYATVRGGSYYGKNMMVSFDVSVDDLYALTDFTNQYGTQYAWTTSSSTGDVYGLWLTAYRVITRSSNLINFWDRLEEGTLEERNQILGEAKLLRAMAHFDLVRVYAKPYRLSNPNTDLGIPIVVQENLLEKSRNTISDVYEFVINEAKEALELMTQNREVFFVGKNAANALLARVYHEMGDWTNAITYSSAVISVVPLSTGTDYVNIWRNDNGIEVIFRTAMTQGEVAGLSIGSNYVGGITPSGPWQVDYAPANELVDLFSANDIRYGAFFQEATPTQAGTMVVTVKYPPTNPAYTQRGANQTKIFRSSEAYLIRAEAYSYSNEGLANADLAALRAARIPGYSHTDLAGDALKEEIYTERRKEFAFEGQRWLELKRRGLGFKRTPQFGSGPFGNIEILSGNFQWLWPIPQHEMDSNTLMIQNPGYVSE